jgi:hypothetical protein
MIRIPQNIIHDIIAQAWKELAEHIEIENTDLGGNWIEEDNIIPETYIDHEEEPREYPLNTLQTVVRVPPLHSTGFAKNGC